MTKAKQQLSGFPDFKNGELVKVTWHINQTVNGKDEKQEYGFVSCVTMVGHDPMYYYVGVKTNRGEQCLRVSKKSKKESGKSWTKIPWSIFHDGNRGNVKIERIDQE